MERDSSRRLSSVLAGGGDTIVARATPEGRGALAIIRVSGPEAFEWARKVTPALDTERGWRAQLIGVTCDEEEIERAIAVAYRAPRSYTGEDMVELFIHGSTFLVGEVIRASVAAGCRVAEPGEFTFRAVANSRMDLLQAEAIRDLIASETGAQARDARRQLKGELSEEVQEIRRQMMELEAGLEAAIGFEEQGVAVGIEELEWRRKEILTGIEQLIAREERGERIREGVKVVITGHTNSGKSTLFNYLVGRERAIVAPEPGTTRDTIEAEIEIAGMKVTLVDTAGLRCDGGEIEREGMRRARRSAAESDCEMSLWSVDQAEEPDQLGDGVRCLKLRTKADLGGGDVSAGEWLKVSVKDGDGMERMIERLEELVRGSDREDDRVTISRRHGQKLREAREELQQCRMDQLELAAEAMRWARRRLEELTGEIVDEDVLDQVFSSFCLGK
jgi:tRNA modification GTPase